MMIVWTIKCPCGDCGREARMTPDLLSGADKGDALALLRREAITEFTRVCPKAAGKTADDVKIEESEE